MSIYCDGTTNAFASNATTPPVTGYGFTVALWFKRDTISTNERTLCTIGIPGSINSSFSLISNSHATTPTLSARAVDNAGAIGNATTANTISDTNWHSAVGIFASTTNRTCVLDGNLTDKGTASSSRVVDAFTGMRVGATMADTNRHLGHVGYVTIWSGTLSDANIGAYAAGNDPATIDAGNILYHGPYLAYSNGPTNTQVGDTIASYALTLNAAAGCDLDAGVNPTITSLTTYVKLLTEASAASKTSIEGVVLNAARDTVIGEFTGQSFEAALESGEAVLLIDVADITPDGSTLTTSDTPIVFAYNATESIIGPGSATVVEI